MSTLTITINGNSQSDDEIADAIAMLIRSRDVLAALPRVVGPIGYRACSSRSEDRHVVDVDGGNLQPDHARRDGVPDLLGPLFIDGGKVSPVEEEPVGHVGSDPGLGRLTAVINSKKDERETLLDCHWDVSLEHLQRVDVECKPDTILPVLDDEHVHDASPSAGEGAEPGLASTPSVEGEPVAGGPFAESPAAPSRTVRWDIELPEDPAVALVTQVDAHGSHTYLGVALDLLDGVEEGPVRVAFTEGEARELHAALGAALAEHYPTQS